MAIAASNPTTSTGQGIQPGRGGFLRNSADVAYISDPTGATVKTGARKGEPKRLPYGAMSGFGAQLENRGALEKYSERKVVDGIGIDPTLATMCTTLAAMPADDRARFSLADEIVMRAKRAAKAWLAADRGTHAHTITEHHDNGTDWAHIIDDGEALGITADIQHAIASEWHAMLTGNGIEILAVERACVNDAWRTAGTLDRIGRLTRPLHFTTNNGPVTVPAGTVLVIDIKTGKTRLTAAIQLASYAMSNPYDVVTEQRSQWPWTIDQTHALIAHLDIDSATCELVHVNIAQGREHGGATVIAAKAWETRTDIFGTATPAPAADGPSPLRQAQLERAATVAQAEARRRLTNTPDEGTDSDANTFAAVQSRFLQLPKLRQDWIGLVSVQATDAKVPFTAKTLHSARRFDILVGLVHLAGEAPDTDTGAWLDANCRAFLDLIFGPPALDHGVPLGHLVGSLNDREAATFAALVTGRLIPVVHLDGTVSLRPAA